MKGLLYTILLLLLTSCWPSRVSMRDVNLPEEWKEFIVETLRSNAPSAPLSFPAELTELIKDGIQNNTRLRLATDPKNAQLKMKGVINAFNVGPIAIQEGDQAAQNRLSVSLKMTVDVSEPKEEQIIINSSRFVDYSANQDFATVQSELIPEVGEQMVQDVINKLLGNW